METAGERDEHDEESEDVDTRRGQIMNNGEEMTRDLARSMVAVDIQIPFQFLDSRRTMSLVANTRKQYALDICCTQR